MRKWLLRFLALLPLSFVEATGVKLHNDSSQYLMVRIYAGDGRLLGQTVIPPNTWNDWSVENGSPELQSTQYSITPFTIHWYCADGGDFSTCSLVGTGATVTALTCPGNCQCKSKPLKKDQQFPEPYGEFNSPPDIPPIPEDNSQQQ